MVKTKNVTEFRGLILTEEPTTSKQVLVVHPDIRSRIDKIIHEFRQAIQRGFTNYTSLIDICTTF
jgi:hypothetical protein